MGVQLKITQDTQLVVLNSHYALCTEVAGLFIYQRFLLSMTLNLHGQMQIFVQGEHKTNARS